ncbi:PilN domain-containing protein [Thiocystis violascens]|uniref:Tfp pilus assembly protein PilN n=1 Tax=Thiocystis violascens (strain ATCC 17096 / DSM 198 / 6111) TaxID=765911 RepID=I3YCR1_THIV6|nr:PilN domain-containing protein [Thiocystis violascens]AFL74779.1 Tfp pilus assembly protein PilN [Thiocystis violascens DSM 198]
MAFIDRLKLFPKSLPGTGTSKPEFFQDLLEQAAVCLPALIRHSLARRQRRLIVEVAGTRARLFLATGQEREEMGDFDLDAATPLPGVILERCRDHGYRTDLLLPPDDILTRSVSFPAQVRGNLHQVMQHELDRLSPFQAQEIVFDYALQANIKQTARLTLDLALCRRDRIGGWIKRMADAGSPIDRIRWAGAWPRANLLPPEERPRHQKNAFGTNGLLAILACLLVLAILLTPVWQKTKIAQTLDVELRDLRTQAIAVDELRQELERARLGSTAVLQRKWEQPPILEMLRELTDRLPDDTWIQSFEYNQGQVDLRGESGQSTALIAILEQAPGIDGVSFKSPVTQIASSGRERFNLSFRFTRQEAE